MVQITPAYTIAANVQFSSYACGDRLSFVIQQIDSRIKDGASDRWLAFTCAAFPHSRLNSRLCWSVRIEEPSALAPGLQQVLAPRFAAHDDLPEFWQSGFRQVVQDDRRQYADRNFF